MRKKIIHELGRHIPFTGIGAIFGIILIILCYRLPHRVSYNIFYIFHITHVVLSAFVTTSMYVLHKKEYKLWHLILIGYFGSVGIGTLSDSIIPYLGETLLNLPCKEIHIGFIEEWWLVNPLAFVSIAVARFIPTTKLPHAAHVLVSTWASLFHIIMALNKTMYWGLIPLLFLLLFIAVWLPCCISDIVFPLLFVKKK